MSGLSAERALRIWQETGLLSEAQALELRAALKQHTAASRTGRGIIIFSTIGATLVGLGILLFIGSNWERIGPVARSGLVFGGYGLVCALACQAQTRGLARVAESLWFLSALALGGAIFLLAQIFNFSLTYWQGPLLWLVGTLAMGHARQRAAYGILAVPLAMLALGWVGGGSGWFMDDQIEFLVGERGLTALLPLIGLAWVSLGLLARRARGWAYLSGSLILWGALLVAVPLVSSTAYDELARGLFRLAFTFKQIVVLVLAVATVAATCATRAPTPEARVFLAGLAALLCALLIQVDGQSMAAELLAQSLLAFAAYVVAVFALSIACVWLGVRSVNRHLINLGVASSSVIILVQYFSWSFEMLPTSFAFILGGIVLIGGSMVMERTRRAMLARLDAS
jgi:uncharacterized membrane protein